MNNDELITSLRELLVTTSDLAYLGNVDPTTLQQLHAEIATYIERTEAAQQPVYKVMAGAVRFVPRFVVARLTRSLTPYILAQVTHHLEPKNAASLAKSFEPDILGQIAVHLDTTTAAQVSSALDIKQLTIIVQHMIEMDFFHRLGEISDVLELDLLRQLVTRIGDAQNIASIVVKMNDHERIMAVAKNLPHPLRSDIACHLLHMGQQNIAAEFQ